MIRMKYNLYRGRYLLYNHPLHVFNIKTMMKNGLRTLGIVTGPIRLNTITKLVYFKEKFGVGNKTLTSLLPLLVTCNVQHRKWVSSYRIILQGFCHPWLACQAFHLSHLLSRLAPVEPLTIPGFHPHSQGHLTNKIKVYYYFKLIINVYSPFH